MFMIWSNEHRAWWGPNNIGYTTNLSKAGVYSAEAAMRICEHATHDWHCEPVEVPVRIDDLPKAARLMIVDAKVTF